VVCVIVLCVRATLHSPRWATHACALPAAAGQHPRQHLRFLGGQQGHNHLLALLLLCPTVLGCCHNRNVLAGRLLRVVGAWVAHLIAPLVAMCESESLRVHVGTAAAGACQAQRGLAAQLSATNTRHAASQHVVVPSLCIV
jgi:hypothetical protein